MEDPMRVSFSAVLAVWKNFVIDISLCAALVLQPRPKLSDLGSLDPFLAFERLKGVGITDDEGNAAAFSLRTADCALDAHASNTGVGTKPIDFVSIRVEHVELWDEDAAEIHYM